MAKPPHADEGLICPFHKADMSTVCHTCPLWTQVRGKHPQTGADVDTWSCAIAFLPVLLLENSKQSRATTVATEDLRNEVVKSNDGRAQMLGSFASSQIPQLLVGQK